MWECWKDASAKKLDGTWYSTVSAGYGAAGHGGEPTTLATALAGIGCCSLGVRTVIFLPLLSFSVNMTPPSMARLGVARRGGGEARVEGVRRRGNEQVRGSVAY